MEKQLLLDIQAVSKSYAGSKEKALNQITLQVPSGVSLGLVGESGSGKSSLAKLVLGLEAPDQGSIRIGGVSLLELRGKDRREARKGIQAVFQDPTASLNSRLPIWKIVSESLENYPEVHPPFLAGINRRDMRAVAAVLLAKVGLNGEFMDRYPHQLSGGQKQRVAIARGISLLPKLLVCDEPTSSLDVSVQAQILNLLKELQQEFGISYLFISHDIASVRYMCDRIAVLKEGQLVDWFEAEELLKEERHPYTKQLIQAVAL